MAVPTYATDLTLIDDAQAVGNFVATGGGGAALGDETDYFINNTQCVSKAGFTATQKGLMADDVTAPSITAGDAVFIWGRQANRNIMDIVANQGGAVIMGTSNSVFAGFVVDGSDVEGSALLSWVNYAVDPTQTSTYTSGSPGAASTWDHFGMEWAILGSGTLKGSPNAVGVIRYGRELTCIDGQAADYATFDGAASFDAGITRRWGILTPVAGGYQFHGAFVMGTVATAVDFRDSDRSIIILEDAFVPVAFNEFEIRNASSNVEWDNIIIQHLGTTSPLTLTLDVGTFTGNLCQFNDCATTTFASTSTCTDSTWTNCKEITAAGANLSGSSVLIPNVAANTSGLIWNVNADPNTDLEGMTFTKTSGVAHHAIEFGTSIPTGAITLTGCNFGTDFSATEDGSVGDETFHFLDTTGTITLNLVGCTGNFGYRTAGVVVTIVADPVTTLVHIEEQDGTNIQNARVLLRASDGTGPLLFNAATTSLTASGTTATCTTSAVHGLTTGDYVVITGAGIEDYNHQVQVTVSSTTVFTYTVTSGIGSPAGGTPVVTGAIISGLTDVNGDISDSRVLSSAQPVVGYARKSTTATQLFKPSPMSGTISNTTGATFNLIAITDE
jgi:hypothetical protein